MGKFDLNKIQNILKERNIDAWLLYDFRGSNDYALNILDIGAHMHLTRRLFYFIPKSGTPIGLVNAIESHNIAHLPGEKKLYASRESLSNYLKEILSTVKTVAMEYSPMNAIPYVSKIDAGTYEFIKQFGVNIVSSADLITLFDAVWTDELYNENIPVANALTEIVDLSFSFIKDKLFAGVVVTEYDVQQFIMNEFQSRNLFTDHPPIVGVNENSANPHYAPSENEFKEIQKGDFVLIDLWAKVNRDDAVWADITWTGYCGDTIPQKYIDVFNIVRDARDAALNLVETRFKEGKEVRGYEVDDASRNVIEKAGYGKYFIHRTGHSICNTLHGSGPHMDNFETKDERLLLPRTSFSIEPGIYITGDFGVRSEIDVYIHPDGRVEQTGGARQMELVAILK